MDDLMTTQATMHWAQLSSAEKAERLAKCHELWALFWFCNNIPFHVIASPHFKKAIEQTKKTPNYTPPHRTTLSGTHLNNLSLQADTWKKSMLDMYSDYGFAITGDGYKSHKNNKYNNFILVTAAGPVYLGLRDVTGESGSGEATAEEFSEVLGSLSEAHRNSVILGITDTPSANRKMWKIMMRDQPRQFWIGCMSHEISLLMGDIARFSFSKRIRIACMKLVKWVMNHSHIFKVFADKVSAHYEAKMEEATTPAQRRACANRKCCVLYRPGDTRMLSIFKLFFRIFMLMEPLIAMFNDADYKKAAQKAMVAYNATTKQRQKKFKKRDRGSGLVDPLASLFGNEDCPIWKEMELWLKANVTIVYFHRIVDTHEPSLHLVYFCSCLVDKHLRMLTELDPEATWLAEIKEKFMTRWYRWHRAIHTAAYHSNPMYQEHKMNMDEESDCKITFKRIWPDEADDIMHGLKKFKRFFINYLRLFN